MARRLALLIGVLAAAAAVGLLLPAAPAAAAPSRVDIQFLRATHELNLAQIDGGKQAQRRGVSKQVRDLGGKFVADHTRLDKALRLAATALRVQLPTEPAEAQQTMLASYATAPAEQFDALYIATQLDLHTAAIRTTSAQLTNGTDARAIKAARDLMAVLRTHYDGLNAAALELDLPSQHTIEPTGPPTGAATAMMIMVLVASALIIAAGRVYRLPRAAGAATTHSGDGPGDGPGTAHSGDDVAAAASSPRSPSSPRSHSAESP